MGTHHFGFSSQHRAEFTFAAQASQTCYTLHQAKPSSPAGQEFGLNFPRRGALLYFPAG
jgi:hypothetical protein